MFFLDLYGIILREFRLQMKNGYTMVRKLKLSNFEIRVAIDALNARRIKEKSNGIDNTITSNLILYLLDALEA